MSGTEAENTEHKRLVKVLIAELKKQGFEITNAASEGYEPCPDVEELVPDVKGYNRKKDYVVFGVAKTPNELCDKRTEALFNIFSSRYMSKGKSKGIAVPFCIAIAKGSEKQLESCLKKLKLDQKKNIFLYAY